MKTIFALCILVIGISLLYATTFVFAKGVPSFYTFEGESLPRIFLGFDTGLPFEPQSQLPETPVVHGAPYILRSYYQIDNETVESQLSPLHYYPQADGTGLIYFVGARDRGVYQEFDFRWYQAQDEISAALNRYIDLGISITNIIDAFTLP